MSTEQTTMTAAQIQTNVLLGSHTAVKAMLEPVIEQIKALAPDCEVFYNGTGGINIMRDNSKHGVSWKMTHASVWAAARAVRSALPAAYRVSKPKGWARHGETWIVKGTTCTITVI